MLIQRSLCKLTLILVTTGRKIDTRSMEMRFIGVVFIIIGFDRDIRAN